LVPKGLSEHGAYLFYMEKKLAYRKKSLLNVWKAWVVGGPSTKS